MANEGVWTREYMRTWEKIDTFTARLEVPGGWLVRAEGLGGPTGVHIDSMTFVPDERKLWKLEEI